MDVAADSPGVASNMKPMGSIKLRPLSLGEILDAAIKIYRSNALLLMKLSLPVLIPAGLIELIIATSALPDDAQMVDGTIMVPDSEYVTYTVGLLIGAILTMLATFVATGALYRAVAQTYVGVAVDWKESLIFGAKRFHRLMWLTLLYVVAIMLGLVALVVPGIWVMAAFSCAIPILMAEGIGGSKALRRSAALVKGRWWVVFGVMILSYLLATIVAGAIVAVVIGFADSMSPIGYTALDIGLSTLATAVTTPFTVAASTVMYFDLRVRKEGFDLELLAREAGIDSDGLDLTGAGGEPPRSSWSTPIGAAETLDADDRPPFWPPPPGWKPRSERLGDDQVDDPPR